MIIKKWKKEYKRNRLKYTLGQLLIIFPEARDYLENEKLSRLKKQRVKLTKIIKDKLIRSYELWSDSNIDGWFFREWLSIDKGEDLEEISKEIKQIEFALAPKSTSKNGVSNEMIEIARNYDWNKLIEVGKNGMTLCPFHSDSRPSFLVKNGYGYCFSEKKSWDTIQFVIDRDGLSFIEAVKVLQN